MWWRAARAELADSATGAGEQKWRQRETIDTTVLDSPRMYQTTVGE